MAKRRTVAELEEIIANKNADIAALYKQQDESVKQNERVWDEWNKGLNRIAELELLLELERKQKESALQKIAANQAKDKEELIALRAKHSELWRAFSHQTSAFASK